MAQSYIKNRGVDVKVWGFFCLCNLAINHVLPISFLPLLQTKHRPMTRARQNEHIRVFFAKEICYYGIITQDSLHKTKQKS